MHRKGRCQLRTQRGARRRLWQPYRSSDLSRKNPEVRVLLAHDAQRRHGTSHKMQNLSRACQDLPPPIRATDLDHKPLAFSVVGFRHTRTPTHYEGQCKFTIVGVDYFTKWAKAEPLITITEQKVRNFI